jgi:dolichyl-phosphate beta-glucosyltransferase
MAEPPAPEVDAPTLSVVIPAYNERQRIGDSLAELHAWVQQVGVHCEALIVDDGSSDGTAEHVRGLDLSPMAVRVLVNTHNRGKGASVRRGMLASEGRIAVICDADMNVPAAEISQLMSTLDSGVDVAIGSRTIDPAEVQRGWLRQLTGDTFRLIRQVLLLPDIGDTQCGFKGFTRAAADAIFPRQSLAGYGFDLEVLAIARHLGLTIREVPVHWATKPGSKVRPVRDGIKLLADVLKVRYRWGRARLKSADGRAPTRRVHQTRL